MLHCSHESTRTLTTDPVSLFTFLFTFQLRHCSHESTRTLTTSVKFPSSYENVQMKLQLRFQVCKMLPLNRKVIIFSRMLTLHAPACARPYCIVHFGDAFFFSRCLPPVAFEFASHILVTFSLRSCINSRNLRTLILQLRTASCILATCVWRTHPVASILFMEAQAKQSKAKESKAVMCIPRLDSRNFALHTFACLALMACCFVFF